MFGISVDSPFANKAFAKEISVTLPLLSDFKREVSKGYGVLDEERQFSRRTTFVVDKEGKIQHVEEGSSAVDPKNAVEVCLNLKKKAG